MTQVNVTTNNTDISVTENGSTTVVETQSVASVTAITAGPQGPSGAGGAELLLDELANVATNSKTTNSVLYWDTVTNQWKGDDINTITTLADGGNF